MKVKLLPKDGSLKPFIVSKDKTVLGRSEESDIVIKDPYVSRKQLIFHITEKGLTLENIGKNPVLLANQRLDPGEKRAVDSSCDIQIGKTLFSLSVEQLEKTKSEIEEDLVDEKTVIISPPRSFKGPRLVVSGPGGRSQTFPLNGHSIFIGRSKEADIFLGDTSVSRRHAVIEKRKDGFYLRGLVSTNPVLVNGKAISEKRLYSGDEIQIGTFTLSFLSDIESDKRPVKVIEPPLKKRILPFFISIFLIISFFLGIFLYKNVYLPFKANKDLKKSRLYLKKGNIKDAQRLLDAIISKDINDDVSKKAVSLLCQIVIKEADILASKGNFRGAQAHLADFLKKYGRNPGSQKAWLKLDQYRFEEAKRLEAKGEYIEAMRKYSLIEKGSPYFEEAKQKIHNIWLQYQTTQLKKQTIEQLLEKADRAFKKGNYLRPVNKNAYATYEAVLSLDPNNQIAKERIKIIRNILRKKGKDALDKGNCKKAIIWFEKYLLISPKDKKVQTWKNICQRRLASGKENKTYIQKKRVEKLLEESGAKSSWIMQYLFDEKESGVK